MGCPTVDARRRAHVASVRPWEAKLDLDRLLQPVSEAEPAGPDLSYDPERIELETLAKGKAEQQMGDVQIAAEEPNWREVSGKAEEQFAKSKDIRVLLWLAVAEVRERGLPGLAQVIKLARGVNEQFWESYYPRLDAEDNNDPTERMNALACLAAPPDTFGDPYKVIRRIREAELVSHPQLGRFAFRDVQIARGDVPPPPPADGVPPPAEMPAIEAAFGQMPEAELTDLGQTLKGMEEDLGALKVLLADKVGYDRMAPLDPLVKAVQEIGEFVGQQVATRSGAGVSDMGGGVPSEGGAVFSGGGVGVSRSGGMIASSADVVRALEDLIRYYEHHEVSSPVPLVLKAAQRLVGKRFLDITRILTPEAIRLVEQMTGDSTEQPPT